MSRVPVLKMHPPAPLLKPRWVCDCLTQQSAAEVTQGAFPDWVMKDHVASTLGSGFWTFPLRNFPLSSHHAGSSPSPMHRLRGALLCSLLLSAALKVHVREKPPDDSSPACSLPLNNDVFQLRPQTLWSRDSLLHCALPKFLTTEPVNTQ